MYLDIFLIAVLSFIIAIKLMPKKGVLIAYNLFTLLFLLLLFNKNYSFNFLGLPFSIYFNGLGYILAIMTNIVLVAITLTLDSFIQFKKDLFYLLYSIVSFSSLFTFIASNLFSVFIFWEITEIIIFLSIYIFGGIERRKAAIKFMLFSILSTTLLLFGLLGIYSQNTSFSIANINNKIIYLSIMCLVIAAMIKIGVVPFHYWVPDAYQEAPMPITILLASSISKFGIYLLSFIMPEILGNIVILSWLIISISYVLIIAISEKSIKKLFSYISIGELGIIGIAAETGSKSIIMLLSLGHGLAIASIFLIIGYVILVFDTDNIDKMVATLKYIPNFSYLMIIASFILVGLPTSSTFFGDLMLFIYGFKEFSYIILTIMPLIAIIGGILFYVIEKAFMKKEELIYVFYNPMAFYIAIALLISINLVITFILTDFNLINI